MAFLGPIWNALSGGRNQAGSENVKLEYLVTVVTGNLEGAGTNASVSLVIKGTKGETDSLKLDKESRLTQEEFSRVDKIGGDDLLAGQRYRDLVTVPHAASVFAGTNQVNVGAAQGVGQVAWIIGAQLRRPLRWLGWFPSNEFAAGQSNYFLLTSKDVGEPLLVTLKKVGGGFDSDWFVDRVTIKPLISRGTVYDFPCNRWVQSEITIFEGTAKLPTDAHYDSERAHRSEEKKYRRSLFKWGRNQDYSDLPGFVKAAAVDELPKDVRFTDDAANGLFDAVKNTLLNLGLVNLLGIFRSWKDFDDYRQVFTNFIGDVPKAAEHWKDDRFFGSQFLNGCNPESIKRCTKLPANFPVTQELVGNLLDIGHTLKKALKEGRIYMVDYKILEDIPHYGQNRKDLERRYMCASLGLFYVQGSGDLVPIAIQLHQQPSDDNLIWTPNDSELDWLCAKLWLRNSDAQFHQMITHLLRTHLFMEPVALASYRQLPTIHPLWKLLSPHIRGILAINTFGRGRLIADGGVADNTLSVGGGGHVLLMQKYHKTNSWTTYNLPQALKKRGLYEADKLPNFYYRDDSLKLWAAIEKFVNDILAIYYRSDDNVVKDYELQNWIKDLHDYGYPVTDGHDDHGVPESFTSRQQLCDFLTAIIFTCSCQHAAVNFSQFDVYGFPPNSPAIMRQPPPTKKGEITMENLMECLATKDQAANTIATVYNLTRIFPDEKFIGDYSEGLFTDAKAKHAISEFRKKLERISAEIEKRNASLAEQYRYPYLLPKRVPNSIAI